ncbi:tRNA (adenosine(37)-N6)-threonylcarbamoyltransferase complex ATPase subunit type 1 TsaE [Dictyobacter arantiisoli]|uniref:tRNA threonylcarbamoyladenosine biosynthesis protein TsaE n=1 Tax=Dictyobacter arantiisoli TaxID=2014874 RepID=A0A5A5TK86_9CHLR|nr:tRNA (adenosine(37)-N6)-threonylcarbamoyltransferase complex ATPase subunit type 1 TsaE [Dictyobacter arantiisoli]GCF11304.1 tRNA (adenosine(37)-N6)-threonylcarbamoyltransferase complex ATPase subunit type 1 TsaE [Dictyobacter arantiisoli]
MREPAVTQSFEIVTQRPTQTQRLGAALGALLGPGDLILLDGQLGAGKTTFTQGLAKGMQIVDVVNSPTFTLLKEYRGSTASRQSPTSQPLALYHFDLYRLDDPDEILDLGFEDYFYGSGVCVVEWAGKADEIWPTDKLYIRLSLVDESKRRLLFVASGPRYCELLQQFQKNTYAITRS